MSYIESIQSLVRQIDAFVMQFNQFMQVSRGFIQMTARLSKVYADNIPKYYYSCNENEFPLIFKEPLHNFSVEITVMRDDETRRAYISNDIFFVLSCTKHGYMKYSISDIHQQNFQQEICKKIDEHLKTLEYNVFIVEQSYEPFDIDNAQEEVYTTFDAAKESARNVAKKLSCLYSQILYVGIRVYEKSDDSSSNNKYVCFMISSKSKGETLRSARLGYFGGVDEYTEISPVFSTDKQEMKQITILAIITLDADGNMNYDIKRSKDKEEARKEADKSLKSWLHDNKLTLDKAIATRNGLSFCSKYDNGNCIEAYK